MAKRKTNRRSITSVKSISVIITTMPKSIPARAHREFWHRPDRAKCCIACGEEKSLGEFYAYGYTTRQGKRGTRYESRCRPCAKARRRAQHAANRDVEIAVSRKWYEMNSDRAAAYRRAYNATEHGKRVKAFAQRIRCARIKAGMSGPEDREAVKAIYADAAEMQRMTGVKLHVDHIVPLSRGGKHEIANLQILTAQQNLDKGVSLQCPR